MATYYGLDPSSADIDPIGNSLVGLRATVSAPLSEHFRPPHTNCRPFSCFPQSDGYTTSQIWNRVTANVVQFAVETIDSPSVSKQPHGAREASSYTPYPVATRQREDINRRPVATIFGFILLSVNFLVVFWTLSLVRPRQQEFLVHLQKFAYPKIKFCTDIIGVSSSKVHCDAPKLVFLLINEATQALENTRSLSYVSDHKVGFGVLCRVRYRAEGHLSHPDFPAKRNTVRPASAVDHDSHAVTVSELSQSRTVTVSSKKSSNHSAEKSSACRPSKHLRSGRDKNGNEAKLARGSKKNARNGITVCEWRCLREAGLGDESCDKWNLTTFEHMLRHLKSPHPHAPYSAEVLENQIKYVNSIYKKSSDSACEMFSTLLYSMMFPDHTEIPYLRFDRLPDESREERGPLPIILLRTDFSSMPFSERQFIIGGRPSCTYSVPPSTNMHHRSPVSSATIPTTSDVTPSAWDQVSTHQGNPTTSSYWQMTFNLSKAYEHIAHIGQATMESLTLNTQETSDTPVELRRSSTALLIQQVLQLVNMCTELVDKLNAMYRELQSSLVKAEEAALMRFDTPTWTSPGPSLTGNPLHEIEQQQQRQEYRHIPELPSSGTTEVPSFLWRVDSEDPDGSTTEASISGWRESCGDPDGR